MKINRPIILAGFIIVLAALAAYHNTFRVPFLMDDASSILENKSIKQLWPLSVPLSPPPDYGLTVSGRPLLNLSVAMNYALSGADVGSYHAVNLLIHVLAGLVLFGLVRRTLLRPVLAEKFAAHALPAALVVALLWTLHPLQTEAVTYIIQRAESLMGLFYLLAIYAFVRSVDSARPRAWQAVSIGACLLGAGCKEVIVTAPVVIFLFDRTLVAGSFREAVRQRWGYYLGLLATWVPLMWWVLSTGGNRGGTFVFTPEAFGNYWLIQLEALTTYLRLAAWPRPLVFEYGLPQRDHWTAVVPHAVVVLVLLGATIWALWRRPVAGFLGASFFLILAPTSLMPGITQVIVEHRMYLPLAAVVALFVGLVVGRLGRRGLVALAVLALLAGWLTYRRNADYENDLTLWRDTVEKCPTSARAQGCLGTAYYNRGQLEEAKIHYQESCRLDPSSNLAFFSLGLTLERMGRKEEAVPCYAEAVRLQPKYAQAHSQLAAALVSLKRVREAMPHLQIALGSFGGRADIQNTFGLALVELGRWPEAVAAYERALRLQPDYAEAEGNLGAALFMLQKPAEAIRHLERALQLDPSLADAHFNLGLVQANESRLAEAMSHYAEAVRLKPGHVEARLNLGVLLAQSGRVEEALAQLQEAVRLKPDFAEAHANLGLAQAVAERTEQAVASYETALRLKPGYAVAHYNLGNALLTLQRWSEAKRHFAEAVRLAPDNTAAREMLDQLQTLPDASGGHPPGQ